MEMFAKAVNRVAIGTCSAAAYASFVKKDNLLGLAMLALLFINIIRSFEE